MSVIVTNLMKMGLADRRGHEVHGRIQTLELTARGTQVLRDAKALVYDLENAMLVALSREDEAVVRRWLVGVASSDP